MAILSKAFYTFNANSIKIPITFFTDRKINSKFRMEAQKTWNSLNNPEQKSNTGGITIPDFKLLYRAITIKTAWYWPQNRHKDHWNRMEDQDINPHIYSHLIFDKGAQNFH
jgi:hypothetical protein